MTSGREIVTQLLENYLVALRYESKGLSTRLLERASMCMSRGTGLNNIRHFRDCDQAAGNMRCGPGQ